MSWKLGLFFVVFFTGAIFMVAGVGLAVHSFVKGHRSEEGRRVLVPKTGVRIPVPLPTPPPLKKQDPCDVWVEERDGRLPQIRPCPESPSFPCGELHV